MTEQQRRRPSFTAFWKKGKERLRGKEIKFVPQNVQNQPMPQSHGKESTSPETSEQSPEKQQSAVDKSKIRRAQVRRAQIQHRQRKAEYVKQLELDAAELRELISLTELEAEVLQKENDGMKTQLRSLGVAIPLPTIADETRTNPSESPEKMDLTPDPISTLGTQPFGPEDTQLLDPNAGPLQLDSETPELFADIDIDDLTVTLKDDPNLGTPCFNIAPSSGYTSHTSPSTTTTSETKLSPSQEHMVINFILGLEHICWNHFFLGDFPGHQHESDIAMGHSLMASTYCMARAPEPAFMERKLTSKNYICEKTLARSCEPVDYQWTTSSISLDSLFGLASSLNPGDKELTPIQGWFELAGRYPSERLLDPQVLGELKTELNGVVKCLQFGAVMERQAFESVVGRVLGS